MEKFYAKDIAEECIQWIKDYAEDSHMKKVVIGMSGGKDSYVAGKLCCEALGKENVTALIMPNGNMSDIADAIFACEDLGIKYHNVNIKRAYDAMVSIGDAVLSGGDYNHSVTKESLINIAPRIRMTALYMIAQSIGARVCGTGNLSERAIGYFTKWGDGACDFNPLGEMTSIEVIEVGRALGLSSRIIDKPPADGLCGKTDEEKLGISYADIHSWIRMEPVDDEVSSKIKERYLMAKHKHISIPIFEF